MTSHSIASPRTFLAAGLLLALGATSAGCSVAWAQTADSGAGSGSGTAADAGTTTAADAAATPAGAYNGPPPHFFLRTGTFLRVGNGIATPVIERTVARSKDKLVDCYKQQLASNPRLHGLLIAQFELLAGGVAIVDHVHFNPRNEPLESCVTEVLTQQTQWPAPRNVPSTGVTLQIDLAPTPPR